MAEWFDVSFKTKGDEMDQSPLIETARRYLDYLCRTIPTRLVGTQGNRDASAYFQQQIAKFGFTVEQQAFECIDSQVGPCSLEIAGERFKIFASPLTLGCACRAELVAAASVAALEKTDCTGKILLLHGEIAQEQLMPKGFEFYNPEEHQHIVRLLESLHPAAILTATSKNPDLAGAVYPFPMITDGDFDIPSAYLTDREGERLLAFSGQMAALAIQAERVPSNGENIVAYKGSRERKIVLSAHIDTKENTPGALDNASGVVILLLLAELLSAYDGELGIELVTFNGEEYYNTPGELEYLRHYEDDYASIQLAINLDNIGYIKGRSAFSFYGVDERVMESIRAVYAEHERIFEGPPWYQSDHGIFIAKGIPAMAVTDENLAELMTEITHTEKDVPEIVDLQKLVENAIALKDAFERMHTVHAA
jgi:aminopeptidase YwaD